MASAARAVSRALRAVALRPDGRGLSVDLGGTLGAVHLSAAWLADHAAASRNPYSKQRDVLASELPPGLWLRGAALAEDGTLVVDWAGEGGEKPPATAFALEDLSRAVARADPGRRPRHRAWGQGLFARKDAPRFPASDLADDARLPACLEALRDFGVLLLDGAPTNTAALRTLTERIGPPQRTYYGEMWSTRAAPGKEGSAGTQDTAYLAVGIKPHTDGTYFRDPPGLQVLCCVSQANEGGETLLVDGHAAAAALTRSAPATARFFATTPLPWFSYDDQIRLTQREPVLRLHPCGDLEQIRFNQYDRGDLPPGPWYDETFLPHWRALVAALHAPEHAERVRLEPGQCVVVDNHRVLHGRTGFRGGVREMIGCYISRDDLESRLRLHGLLPMGG